MKQKCEKCGKEFIVNPFYQSVCFDCKNKVEMKGFIFFGIIVVLLVIGIRLAWAKFVYNDFRCFLAECRITK